MPGRVHVRKAGSHTRTGWTYRGRAQPVRRTWRDFASRSHGGNTAVISVSHDLTMTETLLPQPRPVRTEARLAGRDLALQSRRALELSDLLRRRPELRGVCTWAEELTESVLWSA